MRFLPLFWLCLLGVGGRALAQVTVDLVLDQEHFLPKETLRVGVRITNFSGQTLRFGEDNDWLQLTVERNGSLVVPSERIPVAGEFEVENSTVVTKRVDIGPGYNLIQPGPYTVSASIRIAQWNQHLAAKPKEFFVITGTKLWEQAIGVPAADGSGGPPEIRKYALQQAIHLKRLLLYARVTDANETKFFGMRSLGPMVSFSKPECQIDPANRLHVLFQTGARSFNYSVLNFDGRLVARQTHEYTASRPVLQTTFDGSIIVSGGVRKPDPEDLPALRESAYSEDDLRPDTP